MIYDFRCQKCGSITSIRGKIGLAPAPHRCRHAIVRDDGTISLCNGALERVYYPLGVTFRCSGFYSTDKVLSDPDPNL